MILTNSVWLSGYLFLICFVEKINGVINLSHGNVARDRSNHLVQTDKDLSLRTVTFTQKGYIQFLQYFNKVPTLTEYTFCLWVNSYNLTYNHPLLSYSRHENERLIRVWISAFGTDINLEINGVPVFTFPVNFVENKWYHVCQSWSSQLAAFELFINGKLWTSGYTPKLKGVPIKGQGDIVVGQEYTDFDKGLDDGIEGEVFGFNFVLSATSTVLKHSATPFASNYPIRRQYDINGNKPFELFHENSPNRNIRYNTNSLLESTPTTEIVPHVLSYFNSKPNREPRFFNQPNADIWGNLLNLFETEIRTRPNIQRRLGQPYARPYSRFVRPYNLKSYFYKTVDKSLGSLLVELSFICSYRHGAPLRGKGVLINWKYTPVRVFGGALLRNVAPFC